MNNEQLNNEQLAYEIARGIVLSGVEGPYNALSCSTAGDYPSMGVSQWEGIGGRGDYLLSCIPGGDKFIGRTYSDIENEGEGDALKELLGSDAGISAQCTILASDCLNTYVPALLSVTDLTNPRCIIYSGMWCPTSDIVVHHFLEKIADNDIDINNLDAVNSAFHDSYYIAAEVDCIEGYANRADSTYNYVSNCDLSQYDIK